MLEFDLTFLRRRLPAGNDLHYFSFATITTRCFIFTFFFYYTFLLLLLSTLRLLRLEGAPVEGEPIGRESRRKAGKEGLGRDSQSDFRGTPQSAFSIRL